ncbi:hypothetical protein EQY75_10635 [Muriicola soli]|uniref:Peptidase M56 domain-containing protein n=1 Tax=Muriicola soli TaxID=2507538 RepID=A0A411EB30_9FLAO|nr:hypothetical protein [Muriicola soli]QBA64942.1 hypothetical protein EQY75_10635 [Muriicola soli]
MVIISKYFFYRNYVGLSLWPFIILKEPELTQDRILINHERIHLRQQAELLILPFYLWYISEWICKSVWYLSTYKAYKNLSFEREAYFHESDPSYLRSRNRFGFIKYLWFEKPRY